jgi:uncharacterized protein
VKCPLCRDTDLEPRFAQGTEVDVCPRCRGLWLDRGELERLLAADDVPATASRPDRADDRERRNDRDDRDDRERRPSKPKKSRSKRLADLLDDVLDL